MSCEDGKTNMSKTFLSDSDFERASSLLKAPILRPTGKVDQDWIFDGGYFSLWLSQKLEERLQALPGFAKAQPIALGSWARGELALRSDIDVLFVGDEARVRSAVAEAQEQGLKIRARVPEDAEDWGLGVEEFDQAGLLTARPLTGFAAEALLVQQRRLLADASWKRRVLGRILQERTDRSQRFDDMTQLLEPQIKYGPGGLRDIEQALTVLRLQRLDRLELGHPLAVLNYVKCFLLQIRHKLHLEGFQDTLVAQSQFQLFEWLGFADQKQFMREVHAHLARSLFYSDWLLEAAQQAKKGSGQKALDFFLTTASLRDHKALHYLLKQDQSLSAQKRVRETLPLLSERRIPSKAKFRYLSEIVDRKGAIPFLAACFRSRWIDALVPEIRPLVGYVQFDQYHRYTADAHLYQILKLTKQLHRSPKVLLRVSKLVKKLTPGEWQVLEWSVLFHDLGKGQGHDHEERSKKIAKSYLRSGRLRPKMVDDILWVVEHHLLFTQVAFRKDVNDPKTLTDLLELGVDESRARLLTVFSALDILATNPEAYNDWKSELLHSLWQRLDRHFHPQPLPKGHKLKFDPLLEEMLGGSFLRSDIKAAHLQAGFRVHQRTQKGGLWIRYATTEDQRGVLADLLCRFWKAGLGVEHAFVATYEGFVYDWFKVQGKLSVESVEKRLQWELKEFELPEARFDTVEILSPNARTLTLSFAGKDQKGLLYLASRILSEKSADIVSVVAHTWGRRVEDLFVVKNDFGELENFLDDVRKKTT